MTLTEDALFSPSAVRFGRIPKREKQRLLDEMQSYMNSLNEPASMEMDVSPTFDTPCSPGGAVLQPYSGDEKPLKVAATSSNQSPSPAPQTQHGLTSSYHIPNDFPDNESSSSVDKFSFSPKQNQCPVTGHVSTQTFPTNLNNVPAREFQNQTSCPWKLNGGAKVLVSLFTTTHLESFFP